MKNKRVIIYIIYVLLGLLLFGLGCVEMVDEFWSGMGSAILLIGAIRLLRIYRYNKNEDFREKIEIDMKDERNRFIRLKAWAWAGYLFIMIMAVLVIVLRIVGQELYSMLASYMVCGLLILYWISYMILRKKY